MDFTPSRGSEQSGRRPALVISLDSLHRRMPVCTVAALTSQVKVFGKIAPILPPGQPCQRETQVLLFQVTTIDHSRLDSRIGSLTAGQQAQVDEALRLVWGLSAMS